MTASMCGRARVLAWLLGCLLVAANPAIAMKKFPATDFFSGSQLQLAQAIEHGDLAQVKQLAPATDLNTPGRKNMTMLFYAFQEALKRDPKQLEIMGALIKSGANPLQEVPDFGSVLGVALNSSHPEFLRTLLDAGVNPDTMIAGRRPIIFFVATDPTIESLKLLVARGADINRRDA